MKTASSGIGYVLKIFRLPRDFFWAAVQCWILPIQPFIVFVTKRYLFRFLFPHYSKGFFGNMLPCGKQSNFEGGEHATYFKR